MSRTLISTDAPGWFVDPKVPDKKTRKKDGDVVISQAQHDEQQGKTVETIPGQLTGPTVEITCKNAKNKEFKDICEKTRVIKVQDKFQVERCKPCQQEHRRAKRRKPKAKK